VSLDDETVDAGQFRDIALGAAQPDVRAPAFERLPIAFDLRSARRLEGMRR